MSIPAAAPSSELAKLQAAFVQVTPFQQNCTLIWSEEHGRGVVIDPGGDLPRIRTALAKAAFTPDKILLTHGHVDHASGAAELAEILGVQIIGPHKADDFLLANLESQAVKFGMTGRNVVPDRWLQEGDEVDIAGHTFAVLHCPGHSPGSVVMVSKANQLAIVGDVLFRGSIGRTDFPYGDHAALISSIKTKLLPQGDNIVFLCGHGPPSTLGEERLTNPFLR
jgi:glyoxylase-like metal-dependent hydrolase (beta-lactamase superfamily II)